MATIQLQNGIFIVPIRFSHKKSEIFCWLPLMDKEPTNKKNRSGANLAYRTSQKSRGGYYQMNGGVDVHVFMFHTQNIVDETNWNFHVSHLCHHWWCCNPKHLVKEPDWVNIFRKNCLFKNGCDCNQLNHPRYPNVIKQCIWFNAKEPNHIQFLDEMYLVLDEVDKKRIKSKNSVLEQIKILLE
jgi:hypothetical protein